MCKIKNCDRDTRAKGLCITHYTQWKYYNEKHPDKAVTPDEYIARYDEINATFVRHSSRQRKKCIIEGCGRDASARGLCAKHLQSFYHFRKRFTGEGDIVQAFKQFKEQKKADQVCTVEGCGEKVHAKGLCRIHYSKARYKALKESGNAYKKAPKIRGICSVPGCGKPTYITNGMCPRHTSIMRRYGELRETREYLKNEGPCSVEGCGRPAKTKGMCAKHYSLMRYHSATKLCSVEGCKNTVIGKKELCRMHERRLKKTGSLKKTSKNTGKCSAQGCDKDAKVKGMCLSHYNQQRRAKTGVKREK